MGEVVAFEQQVAQHLAAGRRVGLSGPDPIPRDDGSVEIYAPIARGAALLVHKERTPEFDETLAPICTKCRRPSDIVIVIGFPGGDGEPMQVCRGCLDRPAGKPLVIQFRA